VVAGVDKKLRVVASDVTPDIGVVPSVSGVCCRSRSDALVSNGGNIARLLGEFVTSLRPDPMH
jgi:hypothetical protein